MKSIYEIHRSLAIKRHAVQVEEIPRRFFLLPLKHDQIPSLILDKAGILQGRWVGRWVTGSMSEGCNGDGQGGRAPHTAAGGRRRAAGSGQGGSSDHDEPSAGERGDQGSSSRQRAPDICSSLTLSRREVSFGESWEVHLPFPGDPKKGEIQERASRLCHAPFLLLPLVNPQLGQSSPQPRADQAHDSRPEVGGLWASSLGTQA